jgi:hypothetical protein
MQIRKPATLGPPIEILNALLRMRSIWTTFFHSRYRMPEEIEFHLLSLL